VTKWTKIKSKNNRNTRGCPIEVPNKAGHSRNPQLCAVRLSRQFFSSVCLQILTLRCAETSVRLAPGLGHFLTLRRCCTYFWAVSPHRIAAIIVYVEPVSFGRNPLNSSSGRLQLTDSLMCKCRKFFVLTD
jgi:hypothetical protein